jgi:hypothetical protein
MLSNRLLQSNELSGVAEPAALAAVGAAPELPEENAVRSAWILLG